MSDNSEAEQGFDRFVNVIKAEWDILANLIRSGDEAISAAFFSDSKDEAQE